VAHCVSRTGSDCYISDCLLFDVYSVKRMYNVKVGTGKRVDVQWKLLRWVMMMMMMMMVMQ